MKRLGPMVQQTLTGTFAVKAMMMLPSAAARHMLDTDCSGGMPTFSITWGLITKPHAFVRNITVPAKASVRTLVRRSESLKQRSIHLYGQPMTTGVVTGAAPYNSQRRAMPGLTTPEPEAGEHASSVRVPLLVPAKAPDCRPCWPTWWPMPGRRVRRSVVPIRLTHCTC